MRTKRAMRTVSEYELKLSRQQVASETAKRYINGWDSYYYDLSVIDAQGIDKSVAWTG